MKPSEIKKDKTYEGTPGTKPRRVVADYTPTWLPSHYIDRDYVQYAIKSKRGGDKLKQCTRAAFARWAVREVKP